MLERGESVLGLIEAEEGHAEMILRLVERGVDGDGVAKERQCLVELALLGDESAERVVEWGRIGFARKRLAECGLRRGRVAGGGERGGVGKRLAGGEDGRRQGCQGIAEEGEGGIKAADSDLRAGKVEVDRNVPGIEGVCSGELAQGGRQIALRKQDGAEGGVGGGDVGSQPGGTGEFAAGLVEVAAMGCREAGGHGGTGRIEIRGSLLCGQRQV
jgi:hypothetical protein